MTRTRIKICGITSLDLAKAAVDAGADAIGLVFAASSPRKISIDTAAEIVGWLPPFVTAVGVFQLTTATEARRPAGTKPIVDRPTSIVNPELEQWKQMAHWVQLHGDESEQVVKQVARTSGVIRGFRFDEGQVRKWDQSPHVRMLLLDGPAPGSGRAFRQESLRELMPRLGKPVLIAGGLTPENVGAAIRAARPYGVDVSSGVETEPGKKSPELIRDFCNAVRQADQATHG
jgi:phosphoribosylanthranilate isomerase